MNRTISSGICPPILLEFFLITAVAMTLTATGCRVTIDTERTFLQQEQQFDEHNDPRGFFRTLLWHQAAGLVTDAQIAELVEQYGVFQERRAEFTVQYPEQVVGVAAGEVFVGATPHDVVLAVDRDRPAAMIYMESAGSWIYHSLQGHRPLTDTNESWLGSGPRVAAAFVELRRQRDALQAALAETRPAVTVSAGPGDRGVWNAYVNGKLYRAVNRSALVAQVRVDCPDTIVYCAHAHGRRWDAIPTRAVCGDAFFDHRSQVATMVEIGFGGRQSLLKADIGTATRTTTLDWVDVVGLDAGYRGILVADVAPHGDSWAAGFVDNLRLRTRMDGGEEKFWEPSLVLLTRRSILGTDFMRALEIFPDMGKPSDLPPVGLSRFQWVRWERD